MDLVRGKESFCCFGHSYSSYNLPGDAVGICFIKYPVSRKWDMENIQTSNKKICITSLRNHSKDGSMTDPATNYYS